MTGVNGRLPHMCFLFPDTLPFKELILAEKVGLPEQGTIPACRETGESTPTRTSLDVN